MQISSTLTPTITTSHELNEAALLSQATLNIQTKVRSNLFPWRGQFSPQLVEAHLQAYATPGSLVLDPFAGSGTVLIEGIRKNLAVVGAEINPAAATMARTYVLAALDPAARRALTTQLDGLLVGLTGYTDCPLFSGQESSDVRNLLCETAAARVGYERFVLETLIIILDFNQGQVSPNRLLAAWKTLRHTIETMPFTDSCVRVLLADSRELPLQDSSVDLVLTSPPYINVFNYHQQFRTSVEAIGWKILPLAHTEIGSNRKHRSNRLFTVAQYCLDMAQFLSELCRVCRDGARAILVVGRESNVRKTAFYNGAILRAIAEKAIGLRVLLEQERVFVNRFGQSIYEDIIHLRMSKAIRENYLASARAIAGDTLTGAVSRAPQEVLSDFAEVFARLEDILPSPTIDLSKQDAKLLTSFM